MEIVKYPDKKLRIKSEKIGKVTEEIRQISRDMIEIMKQHNGLGLAAIQIGIPKSIIVINADLIQRGLGIIVLADAEVLEKKGVSVEEEGCLSVPGYYEKVKRAEEVLVEGINYEGMKVRLRSTGYIARAFQHEIDHTKGILYVDRLSLYRKIKFAFKYSWNRKSINK